MGRSHGDGRCQKQAWEKGHLLIFDFIHLKCPPCPLNDVSRVNNIETTTLVRLPTVCRLLMAMLVLVCICTLYGMIQTD
ncbi:hypothetical protein CEXT_723981 [Caerostris extrusa]|uniref:Uncharacterized protein n=1 Tax=Caerostris extrusa TaxID=172846 RepID=A0AAV4XBR1_CAEEX|nr:hypothetical protein CEXT_723981 [Caerostris extrusa]